MNLKNKTLTYKYKCSNNPDHLFEKPTGDFWCPLCNISTRPMLIPFIEHSVTNDTINTETKTFETVNLNLSWEELRTKFQEVYGMHNIMQSIKYKNNLD